MELDVPMMAYSSATVIHIRRGIGNITIYETVLRIDEDHDGVDFEDEVIYGSSDENSDSDDRRPFRMDGKFLMAWIQL